MTEIRRMRPLLGTFVEIGVVGCGSYGEVAIECAFDKIAHVQNLLSFQRQDSELSHLNTGAGKWISMSRESLRVLRLARAFTLKSEHSFNCTIGGILVVQGVLPSHGSMPDIICGSVDDIEIAANQVRLKRPVRITLDGIAKGYAVDAAIAVLKRHGVSQAWVNAGGDMRVFGDHVIPVVQRQPDGSMKSLGGLKQAALATSHYGGESNPRFPGMIAAANSSLNNSAQLEPVVISVIARFAWRADALTKVAALTPASERAQRVAALGGILVEGVSRCVV